MSERLGCPTCGAVFRQDFGYCPLDQTVLAPLDIDPLIGTTLADRYVIERCVGEGGMGRVYRARHRKLDRLFAVKVLYGDLAASSKMRSRFEREARTASKLEHPRLVPVVDFDITEGGLLYLAMSYVEGRELAAIIEDDGPLATDRIRRLLRQLCEGLAYAHDQGMVHRDFKGQNVLVSGQGANERVHILDFGLAFMREDPESSRLTTQGVVMGTPAYMSPEQAMNQELDHRTDLFSLGVLLYEMLAGTLPFQGTPVEVARQNMAIDPPPITRRVPGLLVDPALEGIAFRLMEKLPSERFQSAHEVIAALDALAVSSEPTRSVPMNALAPRNAVDTAGITQDIHVVVKAGAPSGGTHPTESTVPLPGQVSAPGAAAVVQADGAGAAAVQGGEPVEARAEPDVPAKTDEPVAPAVAMPLTEPKHERLVTERVGSDRPRSRRVVMGVIGAALLALLVWWVNRGSAPPAEPVATRSASPEAEAPSPAEPATAVVPPGPTEPAVEATVPAEPAAGAPAPGADEPAASATPDSPPGSKAPATPAQRPRTRPAGTASSATPTPATGRDPKPGAPSGADDRLEKALDETAGPDLVTRYERVGQKLAAFESARGKEAAAPLWTLYRTIPLADALRTPSLGEEALRKLRKIERDLQRAQPR
jgi:serine/threonine-protein kinase